MSILVFYFSLKYIGEGSRSTVHEEPDEWVDGFLLVADRPILDFLNRRPVLEQGPTELLPDCHALERWMIASGMVSSTRTGGLQRSRRHSAEAAAELVSEPDTHRLRQCEACVARFFDIRKRVASGATVRSCGQASLFRSGIARPRRSTETAEENRSDLRPALAAEKGAAEDVSAAKSERWPTLAVNGDYGDVGRTFDQSHGTFNFQAGVSRL
jgi:Outer membrane efflux protein